MTTLPPYLRELEEALLDLPDATDGMLLSEVDGYVCGLALLPEIPAEEWLPAIWRPDPETPDYLYHDRELLDLIAQLAERHFRMVARELHRGGYAPIYDVDERNDEILWQGWISGFDRALSMRPEAWDGMATASKDVQDAFTSMIILASIADGEAAMLESEAEGEEDEELFAELAEERDAINEQAPDMIPEIVDILYQWSREGRSPPDSALPVRSERVGRNDPCPCGSGKKFKKCCGAAT